MLVFLRYCRLRFLLHTGGDAEAFSLELGKVFLLEHETVLEAEVSHSHHGVRLPSTMINQQPLVVACCDNPWKQGPALCAAGNDEAAVLIGSPVDWIQIHMLKLGMANAGACVLP